MHNYFFIILNYRYYDIRITNEINRVDYMYCAEVFVVVFL